jgi:hypothetical protein
VCSGIGSNEIQKRHPRMYREQATATNGQLQRENASSNSMSDCIKHGKGGV